MKFIAFTIVILLVIIAYRIPTPLQIGRGIIDAREEYKRDLDRAREKIEADDARAKADEEDRIKRQADEQLRILTATPTPRATPMPRRPVAPDPTEIYRKYGNPK